MPSIHKGTPHACTSCSYTTNKLGNLKRHNLSVHYNSSASICKFCPSQIIEDYESQMKDDKQLDIDTIEAEDESMQSEKESERESRSESNEVSMDDSIDGESKKEDSDNFWQNLLESNESEQEGGKIKRVKRLYTNLVEDTKLLENDMTHKLIMRAKRKFDDDEDSLARATKKRKLEIERACFSIPEDIEEDDSEDGQDSEQEENDLDNDDDDNEEADTVKNPDILWHNLLEESKSALYPDEDLESLDVQSDKKKKKAILNDVMLRYMDLVEQSEIMQRDPVHKAIQKRCRSLLSQHRNEEYSKAKYDKDEALEKALNERTPLIKKALLDDDEENEYNSDDSDSEDDDDDDSSDDNDPDNEQWLLDIFNDAIIEMYDIEENDVEEKAEVILNDDDALHKILPLVRKKYLNLVLLSEQLKNSELHEKVRDMYDEEESNDGYDSDDGIDGSALVKLPKKEKWKKAIKERTLAIKKTIKKHWVPNEDTADDTDDEEDHASTRTLKRKLEDDDVSQPAYKRIRL